MSRIIEKCVLAVFLIPSLYCLAVLTVQLFQSFSR